MVKRGIYDYNMKPFLTRPQHKFFRGPNYFEIDLDVHEFSYLPKKVWASIRERVDECQVDFGLTIEVCLAYHSVFPAETRALICLC